MPCARRRPFRAPAHLVEEAPALPEVLLVAAILRQAISDAQGRGSFVDRRPHTIALLRQEAREFLQDSQRIAFFATLCGADLSTLQAQLLRAAGLSEAV
jgi:hypothetical protein